MIDVEYPAACLILRPAANNRQRVQQMASRTILSSQSPLYNGFCGFATATPLACPPALLFSLVVSSNPNRSHLFCALDFLRSFGVCARPEPSRTSLGALGSTSDLQARYQSSATGVKLAICHRDPCLALLLDLLQKLHNLPNDRTVQQTVPGLLNRPIVRLGVQHSSRVALRVLI